MIRFALLGCLTLVLSAAAPAEDKKGAPVEGKKSVPAEEVAKFKGTWKVVDAAAAGKPEPKDKLPDLKFIFEDERLTVTDKGKSEYGSYTVDPTKDPAAIDLTTPMGDKVAGIYKFDKDGKLTLSFIKSKDAARPKEFNARDAVTLTLEKAADKVEK